MRPKLSTIVALASLVTGAVAEAQQPIPGQATVIESGAAQQTAAAATIEPERKPGYHTHDGFFLQLSAGAGYVTTSASESQLKVSGTMGGYSATVGGSVLPNLIVGAQLWQVIGFNPDVQGSDAQLGAKEDVAVALYGLGLNLTYYLMRANVFLSATPSVGTVVLARDLRSHDTELGIALRLAAGKEWWVSDNWAIGVMLQYAYGSNAETSGGSTWTTHSFGLGVSGTYD